MLFCFFFGCKKSKSEQNFDTILVDKNIVLKDTIKLLSKLPEIKNFESDKIRSKSRTSSVSQKIVFTSYYNEINFSENIPNEKRYIYFDNYKASAELKNDTINLYINNNNGEYGNGILIMIFGDKYSIKNINPKTIHNELKFIDYKTLNERLVLDKSEYKRNDSIYGFINYTCQIEPNMTKTMKGCFRTLIK